MYIASAGFTFTVSVAVLELLNESVTFTQYVEVDDNAGVVYVDDVAPPIVALHPAFEYH